MYVAMQHNKDGTENIVTYLTYMTYSLSKRGAVSRVDACGETFRAGATERLDLKPGAIRLTLNVKACRSKQK